MRRRATRQSMLSPRVQRLTVGVLAVFGALMGWVASAQGKWVIHGRAFGHGVGMSQYGAYGYAKHGRGYHWILGHYYRHTRVGHARPRTLQVLLGTAQHSVRFTNVGHACTRRLHPGRTYRFTRSRAKVILRNSNGRRLENCGRTARTSGKGAVRIFGDRDYRGDLTVRSRWGELLVINDVGLNAYVKGVVPNEMPASWSAAALRAQAVAARSYALATRRAGAFDLYDDTRDQVYGGKDSEAAATNAAARHTAGRVVRHGGGVATTYFFSTSGGRTENVEYGFPGSSPQPYLKSVRDRYDGISPYHSWRVTYSRQQMANRLSGLFSGRLRRIRVTKRGISPRIVRARVVGSHGSSKVSGPTLEARLGLRSTWAFFKRRSSKRSAGATVDSLAAGAAWDPAAPAGAATPSLFAARP